MNLTNQDKYIEIRIENESYGIHIEDVQEIIRYQEVTRLPASNPYLLGIIQLRDELIQVASLSYLLGKAEAEKGKASRIVIVKWGESYIGLSVDQVTKVSSYASIRDVKNIKSNPYSEGILLGVAQEKEAIIGILNLKVIANMIT